MKNILIIFCYELLGIYVTTIISLRYETDKEQGRPPKRRANGGNKDSKETIIYNKAGYKRGSEWRNSYRIYCYKGLKP